MFNIVRIILCCLFLLVSIFVIKRSKITRRKRVFYVIVACLSIVMMVILSFLPFENLYMTFHSPIEAYEYTNFGSSDVKLVVEGNHSAFVVGNKNDSDVYLIVPKTAKGWKVGLGANTKRIIQKIFDGIVVYVYQYKDTNDYYITVFNTNGGPLNILDSVHSKFDFLENKDESLKETFVTYYAHISEFDSSYWINVDGNKISLSQSD